MEKKRNRSDCCCSVLEESYETVKELGEGGQGIVMLCRERASGRLVACKTASAHNKNKKLRKLDANRKKKEKDIKAQDAQIRWEAEVLARLRGVHGIVRLEKTLEGQDGCIHLLTTYCEGGDLLLAAECNLGERQAARLLASLARSLASCHKLGLVHRDVKPQNVFVHLKEGGGDEEYLVADFGLAADIIPGESLSEPVGTSFFKAPEVILRHYDHRADIWSLGVAVYLLLTGSLPFVDTVENTASDADVYDAILHNDLYLDSSILSRGACDILSGMLCKDPLCRLTLDNILKHPWVVLNTVKRFRFKLNTYEHVVIPCPPPPPIARALATDHGINLPAYLSHSCTRPDAAAQPAMADEVNNPPTKVRAGGLGRDCESQYGCQRTGAVAAPSVY